MKKTPPHLPDEEKTSTSPVFPVFRIVTLSLIAGLCGGAILMYYALPDVLTTIVAPLRTTVTVEKEPEKVAYDAMEQVVVEVMKNNKVVGGGVSISNDGLIITDASLVGKNMVIQENKRMRDAGRVLADTVSGLAIIATPETTREIVKTSEVGEVMGKRLFVYIPQTGIVETSATARFFIKDLGSMMTSDMYDRVIPLAIAKENVLIGGPVFTANGDCVGIVGETKTPQGFATFTPISRIMEVYKPLIKDEVVERPRLGITAYDVGSDNEVVVAEIAKGSPADLAGIKVFDKITAIEGKSVGKNYSLSEIILQYKKGKKISVTVNGVVKEIELGGQKTSVVY